MTTPRNSLSPLFLSMSLGAKSEGAFATEDTVETSRHLFPPQAALRSSVLAVPLTEASVQTRRGDALMGLRSAPPLHEK